MFEIKGKSALVTGGTEGIGLALTRRLLEKGARVVVANRNAELASEVLSQLRTELGAGEDALSFVKMDAGKEDEVKAAFAEAAERLGGLDIVVANAGFSCQAWLRLLDKPDDGEWERGIQGNLVGTMVLGRLASTHWLKEDKAGVFVVTSSLAAITNHPCMSYATTKAAQLMFTTNSQFLMDQRARGKSKARYNAILPGMTFTPIFTKGRFAEKGIKTAEDLVEKDPFFANAVKTLGGWTPMDKLIDAYIMTIEDDEKCRGTCWVVSGTGGEAKQYPAAPINALDYCSIAG
ncbi:hypothetical protein DFJ74DRAFT_770692 [Hyaloraphidium curvatum]|nr:hypothetical protein DFJ74DRAFT_770692 [Hyaloraphidium curvatum]